MRKLNVAVVAGGTGKEREVSLQAGLTIFQNLNRNKYNVQLYDIAHDLPEILKNKNQIDVAFLATRGRGGADGSLQGFFELMQIPYTGSGIRASANAVDKITAKKILICAGISSPDFLALAKKDGIPTHEVQSVIGLPCVVKPARGDSTLALSIVEDIRNLEKAVRLARREDDYILIEKYIPGGEYSVLVAGGATPFAVSVYDLNAPVTSQVIPDDIEKRLSTIACRAYEAIGCNSVAEVDLILDEDRVPYVLEINTIPNMQSGSKFAHALVKAKIQYSKFLDKIISFAPKKGTNASQD